MNKQYCINCGAGTAFEYERPKFCASCGKAFAGVAVAKVAPKVTPISSVDVPEEEETVIPKVDKENFFEITGLERTNVFKGEELFGTSQEERAPRKGSGPKVNKKQFLKNFSERASSKTKTIEVK